jgi:NADH-quinone oxidoreductase subunit L
MEPMTLASMMLLLPLASALAILLLHGLLRSTAHLISTMVSVVIWVCAVLLLTHGNDVTGHAGLLFPFLQIGSFSVDLGFVLDHQSRGMMFIVTFVGMLVHIYSLGYMKDDPARARYFGALSLFMFSMTGIVLAGNFLMMFLFWELVGLSSYLLIGHWFQKPSACDAANKAFLTNRIGDFGFMAGILILFGLNNGDVGFDSLATSMVNGNLHHAFEHQPWLITLAALGIFCGAVGKSAQFPLHVWLPDAMEGPTPVSALIHAATMVAAGVYMLARAHFLIAASGTAEMVIAWTGGLTALLAALMATQQNDIKKILAYSTLSQLGYMVMAQGLGASEAGMFHLYTHAFFKALLFLGAGAVIHACHHEQDIWKMGGLKGRMPATFFTFAAGTAALMGVPLTSGFFSKENILAAAYPHNFLLFLIGIATAFLTAFYMTRLVVVVFAGKTRSEAAGHAHEVPLVMLLPLGALAIPSLLSAYGFLAGPLQAMMPQEGHEGGPVVMIASIAVLIAGFLGATKLYRNAEKDPVNLPLFANKFYIDEIYAVIVKYAQDRLAWIVNALEKLLVDSTTTRLPVALASGLGGLFRRLQNGNLQSYAFLFGAGVVAAIYLAVFLASKP